MKRLLGYCCVVQLALASVAFATVPELEDDEEVVELEFEGVVVESTYDLQDLQLFQNKAMMSFVEQLQLRDEATREAELQKANQSSLTTVLDLTRYVPIPLGSSGRPVDTYFLENHMRPDLNPRQTDPLALESGSRR